jgi:hypothetical protein
MVIHPWTGCQPIGKTFRARSIGRRPKPGFGGFVAALTKPLDYDPPESFTVDCLEGMDHVVVW